MSFLKWFFRWFRYSLHGGVPRLAEIAGYRARDEFNALFRFLNISGLTKRAADLHLPCGHSWLDERKNSETGELFCGVCGASR